MDLEQDELALLNALLNEEGIDRQTNDDAIRRLDDDAVAPVSFQQERLWLLHQVDPGFAGMNMTAALRLSGRLHVSALERALSGIVERHEPLRTTFAAGPSGPHQIVRTPAPMKLPVEDFSRMAPSDRDAEVLRRVHEEMNRPFDLERGPVFRVRLLKLTGGEHVLTLALHHIIADGWSIGVFAKELGTFYRAFSQGKPVSLSPLPVRYRDYAASQREQWSGERLREGLDYWREQLARLPALQLPTDRRRPAQASAIVGGREPLKVPASLSARLRACAEAAGATVAMAALATWQMLLSRYSGQLDVVVGIPVANRNLLELEPLIGFFVNMLVIRTDLGGRPSFHEVLRRVKATTLAAYQRQEIPFQLLVDELRPDRLPNQHPLFQVALAFQNTAQIEMELPDLTVSRAYDNQTARFDLEIFLGESGDELAGSIAYDRRLFDPETISGMARHWVELLSAAVSSPYVPVASLPLLPVSERRAVLEAFQGAHTSIPAESIGEMFAAQVARVPHSVAVSADGVDWTFAELDRHATRIALFLRERGFGTEKVAAIQMERCPELVASVLGVLKAGGAYLPLDPAHPEDRLRFMVENSGAVAILGRGDDPRLQQHSVPWLSVDRLSEAAEDFPWQAADPQSLAYLIYTSGSTGEPKGSAITHGGLLNYLTWALDAYEVEQGTGSPLHSSIAFDLTVTSLFPALLAGRPVLLVPEGKGAGGLAETLRRGQRVSPLKLTPAHLSVLNNVISPADAGGCAHVMVVGGEQLLPEHVAFWRRHAPGTRLINEYGPTEAVVGCCVHEVAECDLAGEAIPIGRPIANTPLYVLDPELEPLPMGIPGELWIAGAGLARGYHGRPDLTAMAFRPDPFGSAGQRMYRTGDRVRRRRDGSLEFLGRIDEQVKLRGYRIELGEIEAVLARHSSAKEVAVLVREDKPGDRRLVAYVVPQSTSQALDPAINRWEGEQIDQWRTMFEQNYRIPPPGADPTFNPIGWNSSYDGQPMPEDEIRDWLDHTVAHLVVSRSRRVLEIGCGSGLIVFRLAPLAEEYVACDFAAGSVEMVGRHAAARGLDHVRVMQREASDFAGIPARWFDRIIMNSVVQYFASVEYLLAVIEGAIQAAAPGAEILIGDVRDLNLLSVYHASVQFCKADDSVTRSDLAVRVRRALAREEELVLSPDFFRALPRIHPEITQVEIRRRSSAISNELTKFRYDAILRMGGWHAGPEHALSPAVAASLEEDLCIRDWLEESHSEIDSVGAMRACLRERLRAHKPAAQQTPEAGDLSLPLSSYANNPLHAKLAQFLIPDLKQQLKSQLPDYMQPSDFVLLERMPLTVNGKIDRRALPAPVTSSAIPTAEYVAARSPEEELLSEIWGSLLDHPQIGVTDNFFDLGGHSLMAAQVVARIRTAMGIEVPLAFLFDAPTIAQLSGKLADLRGAGTETVPPLIRRGRGEPLPLSFAQERLWFLEKLEPGRTTYHVPVLLRLTGKLVPEALEWSLSELQRRHEVLRTSLLEENGRAWQVPNAPEPFRLKFLDLSDRQPETREAEARAAVEAENSRLFDLARGRVLRATLVRLTPAEHLFSLVVHHIASDGWSVGVAVREIVALYDAYLRGEHAKLPDLPLQYADYAAWQREWLQGDALESRLDYWRSSLADPPVLDLPADFKRPPAASGKGARLPFALSGELTGQIQTLARANGATLFMALLAGFYLWLSRESGEQDLVVGTPVANRQRREIEPLIGFFVNTLALRLKVDDRLSFGELLDQTRGLCLTGYAHQDVPFEAVVEAVSPRRDPSRTPLFQVMLVLLNAPATEFVLEGLRVVEEPLETGTSKFDLTLLLGETDGGLAGEWEFSTDLFTPEKAARFSAHFTNLLRAGVSSPNLPMGQLSMMGTAERHAVLYDFNATGKALEAATIPALIETQASRRPDGIALVSETRTLTYGELNKQANRLAHHLIRLGVGTEDRIAIVLERSVEMVISLLAVMKAGAAYVPMDPDYPEARLLQMMADCTPSLVITRRARAERLGDCAPAAFYCWDGEEAQAAMANSPVHDPADADRLRPLRIENAAYVIYTSGSTGTPKGVVLTHRGIASLAGVHIERLRITPDSRFLQFASFSFDSSVVELVMALGAGAALVLTPQDSRSGAALREFLLRQRVTHVQLPPAVLSTLDPGGDLPVTDLPVTDLIVAGEACSAEVAAIWSRDRRLFNAYGPTEATVAVTLSAAFSGEGAPPIGGPIWNTQLYVLDKTLEPVPVGTVGELYIAGAGLARGYFGRPDLTAERFLPNPFEANGGRMYRTGDRASWRPDGTLDFLGRADHQIKLRGFRIEPGEIEATLRLHPSVTRAAVIAREDTPGQKQLVAYVVSASAVPDEPIPDEKALRGYLTDRLPHYMVPSNFLFLPALPLNSNGKLDRQALPIPTRHGGDQKITVGPRSALEFRLAKIWEKILGTAPVGLHEEFFDLGGHSLLAPRLLAAVEKSEGVRIPLNFLFQHGTVEGMAQAIAAGLPPEPFSPLVRMKPAGSLQPFFCVHPAAGSVLSYYAIAEHFPAERPFYGLQAPGYDGEEKPLRSVEELATLHLAAIREAFPSGPYHLGGHSFGASVAYEMACQLGRTEPDKVGCLVMLDHGAPGPSFSEDVAVPPSAGVLAFLAREIGSHFGVDLEVTEDDLAGLEEEAQLSFVVDRATRAGVAPPGAGGRMIAGMASVYRASLAAALRYQPQPFHGGLTLLRTQQPHAEGDGGDETAGWSQLVRGRVRVRLVGGDHNTMVRAPHAESLAAAISEELNHHEGPFVRE